MLAQSLDGFGVEDDVSAAGSAVSGAAFGGAASDGVNGDIDAWANNFGVQQ